MKNVAEFKRAMTVGSRWHTTHQFKDGPLKDKGIRECGLANTVNFAFKTEKGDLSYCDWPKKQFFTRVDDNTIQITGEDNWMTLTYHRITD